MYTDFIQRIKDSCSLADYIRHHHPNSGSIKKSSGSYSAMCPFHTNTNTPAFVIYPDRWVCFGSCKESGDLLSYIKKYHGVDFMEAVKIAADYVGMEVPKQKSSVNAPLKEAMREISQWYQGKLTEKHVAYLTNRGLTEETIREWGLGWCDGTFPPSIDKGVLLKTRVLREDDGRSWTANRITIPICDTSGNVIAFGARAFSSSQRSKYVNSFDSPIFSKKRTLFGLHKAKSTIVNSEKVVLVEGYFDVMMAHQTGTKNCVAMMGSYLNEKQFSVLNRYTKKFIIGMDGDDAGEKSVTRMAEMLATSYEIDQETSLFVAQLPSKHDPDDLIRKNHDEWLNLINNPQPLYEHFFEANLRKSGESLQDKVNCAKRMIKWLRESFDNLTVALATKSLAEMLDVSPEMLGGEIGDLPLVHSSNTTQSKKIDYQKNVLTWENAVVRSKKVVLAVNRLLAENRVSIIKQGDFVNAQNYECYKFVMRHGSELTVQQLEDYPYIAETIKSSPVWSPKQCAYAIVLHRLKLLDRSDDITKTITLKQAQAKLA